MRTNFRDFFTYAIKGSQSDPINPGVCPSACADQSHCCANVVATKINFKITANDNLCILESVANAWSDFVIEDVKYTMKCAD